jgi:hypothetical protein
MSIQNFLIYLYSMSEIGEIIKTYIFIVNIVALLKVMNCVKLKIT